jgi:hypothetical protein
VPGRPGRVGSEGPRGPRLFRRCTGVRQLWTCDQNRGHARGDFVFQHFDQGNIGGEVVLDLKSARIVFDGRVPGRHFPVYVDKGAFSALHRRALAKSPFAAKGTVLPIVPDPHSVDRAIARLRIRVTTTGNATLKLER